MVLVDSFYPVFTAATILFGKHQGEDHAGAPALGTVIGTLGPVSHTTAETDHLAADLGYLGDHQDNRYRPLFLIPVIGGFAQQGKETGFVR